MILDVTTDDKKEADKLFTKIKDSIDEFIEENDFEVLFTISGEVCHYIAQRILSIQKL